MGFERGVIFVEFVNKEAARFGFVPVNLVGYTAGFFP
jgi:hypothetical protein